MRLPFLALHDLQAGTMFSAVVPPGKSLISSFDFIVMSGDL